MLTIMNAKFSWYVERVTADKSCVFTLGSKDTASTNGTDYKHAPLYLKCYELPTVQISTVELSPLISIPADEMMPTVIK